MKILRGPLLGMRTKLELKSRKSKERPTHLPMLFSRNGQVEEILVPIDEYVPVMTFLEMGMPRRLEHVPHILGFKNGFFSPHHLELDEIKGSDHVQRLAEKYGADSIDVEWEVGHGDFCRFVAKICHCEAILHYGYSNFRKFYLQDAILGRSFDILDWAGSDGRTVLFDDQKKSGALRNSTHIVGASRFNSTEVVIRLKLWNLSRTPEYLVVVGSLHPKFAEFLDIHHQL